MEPLVILAILFLFVGWITSIGIAFDIGREKGRLAEGVLLPVFFGPVGLIAVCLLPGHRLPPGEEVE